MFNIAKGLEEVESLKDCTSMISRSTYLLRYQLFSSPCGKIEDEMELESKGMG